MRAHFDTTSQDWDAEAISRLSTFWAEGHSTAEIGRRMGLTKNSIVGKAHRLNLPPRPSPIRRGGAGKPEAVLKPERRGDQLMLSSAPSDAVCTGQAVQKPKPAQPSAAKASKQGNRRTRPSPASSGSGCSDRASGFVRGPVPRSCCWPIGEPGKRDFHFCEATATSGKPYCAEHARIAYVKVDERRDGSAPNAGYMGAMK